MESVAPRPFPAVRDAHPQWGLRVPGLRRACGLRSLSAAGRKKKRVGRWPGRCNDSYGAVINGGLTGCSESPIRVHRANTRFVGDLRALHGLLRGASVGRWTVHHVLARWNG